jgi:hypothetical protein
VYVYTIDPVGLPTIDVNAELGAESPYPDEQEIAVPGGIRYQNVRICAPFSMMLPAI